MDTAIKFLYLSEPDMIRAGVTDMDAVSYTHLDVYKRQIKDLPCSL